MQLFSLSSFIFLLFCGILVINHDKDIGWKISVDLQALRLEENMRDNSN